MQRLFFFAVFCLAISACSGRTSQTSKVINVVVSEYRYVPAEWRIPAGQDITLQISNQGQQDHEWVLLKDPPSEPFDAGEEANILFKVAIKAGQSLTIQFKAPAAPGEYSVTSGIPGDLEKGLEAKVVIVQPGF